MKPLIDFNNRHQRRLFFIMLGLLYRRRKGR